MKICITLDDVLRAKTVQFGKMYQRYIDNDIDLDKLDLSSGDLCEIFFDGNILKYHQFLYEDYPFEIFAEASPTTKMVDKNLILWHMDLVQDEDLDFDVELMLANTKEFNASIGNTYFFLSKIATRIREVYFPVDGLDIWNKCDILITADNRLLENKPENKISIKISTPYNEECEADYTYETLQKFIDDKEKFKSIITENINNNV